MLLYWNCYIKHYSDYNYLVWYFLICLVLASLLLVITYLVSIRQLDIEKSTPYECGFEPFDDAHKTLDIHFYVVGVLFLIFDLEVAFLFPWSVIIGELDFYGFFVMVLFLGLLTLGFVYEWSRGALDWSSNYK